MLYLRCGPASLLGYSQGELDLNAFVGAPRPTLAPIGCSRESESDDRRQDTAPCLFFMGLWAKVLGADFHEGKTPGPQITPSCR